MEGAWPATATLEALSACHVIWTQASVSVSWVMQVSLDKGVTRVNQTTISLMTALAGTLSGLFLKI